MAELNDLINKITRIDALVENALRNEVAEAVKDAIVESARQNVYEAYTPVFESRRNGNGGILDRKSIDVEVRGNELIAKDNPDWQQLWGGHGTGIGSWRPSTRLSEAIANGERRFNMHRAGPRPFHEKAKEELISSGAAEEALKRGLARQGLNIDGLSITIT